MAQFNNDKKQLMRSNDTLYEVVMIADQFGNVTDAGGSVQGTDAFGRQRMSQPFTLFEAFNRYDDNGKFFEQLTNATAGFGDDSASIDMTLTNTSGDTAIRESKRVFAYQPGKSLQVLNTFVMSTGKTGLRQRVGYFGTNDGLFLELDGTDLFLVKRSQGSDTRVAQSSWNIDTADGNGASGFNLNIATAQIFWMDIEWLGVGSVRCGFVYNGQFVHVHTFHHANTVTAPYMTTACLPIRYEIENTAGTSGASTLKQICSTVISEGGYSLSGVSRTVGHPITGTGGVGKELTNAGTYYPIAAIRLKDDQRDAIVLPTGIDFVPNSTGNNSVINWRVYKGATVGGGSWNSAGSTSSVNYNLTPTSFSGGELIVQGFAASSNQSAQSVNLVDGLFKYQLERNADSSETFLIAAATNTAADEVAVCIDWEEVT